MAKITQYPAKTVPSNNDEFVLHDPASGSTKKMTRGDLISGAPLPANSVDEQAITDGAVKKGKVDFDSGIWWEEIGRVELSTAGASANITIEPKKFMRILATARVASGSSINIVCTVNNDSGSNYTGRYIAIGNTGNVTGTVSGVLGQLAAATSLSTGNHAQFDFILSRVSNSSPLIGTGSTSSLGATGGGNERMYLTTAWNNTTTAVSSINFSTAGTMTGTFVVLGHD